jgi:outer membrane protein assembly factor BamA
MKRLLSLVLACFFYWTCALGQSKEAIENQADTMQKYMPEQQLSRTVTVKHIVIEGNAVTRRSIILREMSVHEGDTIVTDSIPHLLNQNKLRLINLSLFNEIELNIDKINANEIAWHIKVKERWYILPKFNIELADRNFNTWYVDQHHDLSRVNVGLTVYDYNFRGNLEYLSGTVQLGYTRMIAMNYQKPYIDKQQKLGIGFGFSHSMSRQTYYTTDSNKLQYVSSSDNSDILQQTAININFVYRPAYATKHRFMITYKDYRIGDTIVKLNPIYYEDGSNKAKLIELVYRLELNHVDNWNYPLYGFKFVGYAVSRIGMEGISAQHFINVETGVFGSPLPKWYVSAILRGRLTAPEKQSYYFTGGLGTQTDYVRGYEYYVIDGSQYGLLRFDLKREIFNRTYYIPVKYFTAIPLRIYPKIFADVGYIKSQMTGYNSFLDNEPLYSIGAGLDIVTLYDLKIRLEFAYNHLQQNGLYLHFNSE